MLICPSEFPSKIFPKLSVYEFVEYIHYKDLIFSYKI